MPGHKFAPSWEMGTRRALVLDVLAAIRAGDERHSDDTLSRAIRYIQGGTHHNEPPSGCFNARPISTIYPALRGMGTAERDEILAELVRRDLAKVHEAALAEDRDRRRAAKYAAIEAAEDAAAEAARIAALRADPRLATLVDRPEEGR